MADDMKDKAADFADKAKKEAANISSHAKDAFNKGEEQVRETTKDISRKIDATQLVVFVVIGLVVGILGVALGMKNHFWGLLCVGLFTGVFSYFSQFFIKK